MKMSRKCVLAVAAVLLCATLAVSEEKKINRSDLPPAVEKTVASQSEGAIIKGFSQEKEHGQTFYEAEMMINGHSKDVLIDSNGGIAEVEEEVAMDSLPGVVKDGLQAKAGKGKLAKVESLTKHDKLVAYEAVIQKNGKRSEIQVGPDGKPLHHEE
jgi:hypothetical protein